MPIISTVGARSLQIRLVYAVMFTVLTIGAATMVYPFLLMLSGSVKSKSDFQHLNVIPRYFTDDHALWPKYIESKYGSERKIEYYYGRPLASWRLVKTPQFSDQELELAELFIQFRDQFEWPMQWYQLGHIESKSLLAKNSRLFREAAKQRYDHDIIKYSDAVNVRFNSWSQIGAPNFDFMSSIFTFPQNAGLDLYYELKAQVPRQDWIICDLDSAFWAEHLRRKWAKIEDYNTAHGTNHPSYRQVVLTKHPPPAGLTREDWEQYVRVFLNPAFIEIAVQTRSDFHRFLKEKAFPQGIVELNLVWKTNYESFDQIDLPHPIDDSVAARHTLLEFIKNSEYCPLDQLSVDGPRYAFETFVAKKRGVDVDQVAPLRINAQIVDYLDMKSNTSEWRWEFFTRNYKTVFDYIFMHGNGVRNTIIYCSLMIFATLLVNPLAAYALSRYKPPTTYTVLLFCMCTMAFPAEVTMIPSFLLLKRFPFYPMAFGLAVMIAVVFALYKLWPRGSEWHKVLAGLAIGILAGWWLAPQIAARVFGVRGDYISLLNTFWALILPSMANGYSIFLLKGFFDSLPRDLYEAADIDGASEWTKFWTITMSLSKPILAVIALGAFTAAYGEFMMALVIIPDQNMWTIMVWLFQLQSYSHPTVIYASLVVAAVPTLLVFLFCQNLIMRGIVVPVEK